MKPFLQDVERGVFATRAPCRPNPIGLSIVKLVRREGNVLHLDGVDVLDGTPLLDIKPYTARFDRIDGTRNGWQDEVDEETARLRGRRATMKIAIASGKGGTGKTTVATNLAQVAAAEWSRCGLSRLRCRGAERAPVSQTHDRAAATDRQAASEWWTWIAARSAAVAARCAATGQLPA